MVLFGLLLSSSNAGCMRVGNTFGYELICLTGWLFYSSFSLLLFYTVVIISYDLPYFKQDAGNQVQNPLSCVQCMCSCWWRFTLSLARIGLLFMTACLPSLWCSRSRLIQWLPFGTVNPYDDYCLLRSSGGIGVYDPLISNKIQPFYTFEEWSWHFVWKGFSLSFLQERFTACLNITLNSCRFPLIWLSPSYTYCRRQSGGNEGV